MTITLIHVAQAFLEEHLTVVEQQFLHYWLFGVTNTSHMWSIFLIINIP